ncbi:MAG: hypothetical protein ABR567_17725 [Myxococcales bacterium]|nr:hypothetical protein [Myxococcales bacterium]
MKKLIREWGFPVALIVAWALTTAYSISVMAASRGPHPASVSFQREPPRV